MAYQLSSYVTSSGISLPSAYLIITLVNIAKTKKEAMANYSIYATADTSIAGDTAVESGTVYFVDSSDGTSLLYTDNFACVPGTDPSGTQPTDVDGILYTQAYLALKNHPSLTTILTGATSV